MSYVDILRTARSSRVSVVHKFLTNYDPNADRVYSFVEGDADVSFYRTQIKRYLTNERKLFTYNCEGKAGVASAYEDVVKKYPTCERVLFFLDKDVDDIVGVLWPSDPRIFVTECYSIENYVVSKDALRQYLQDFVKIRKCDIDVNDVLEQFDQELACFHRVMVPIMAWIVIMKRSGCAVVLQDVNLGELFRVTDRGIDRRLNRCAVAYLTKITQAKGPLPTWWRVRATCKELARLPAKSYIRGKFEAWWFVEFGRRMLDGLQRVANEVGGSVKVQTPLHASTFIQLLGTAIETPVRLEAFLIFHLKSAASPNDDARAESMGKFARLASFLKLG